MPINLPCFLTSRVQCLFAKEIHILKRTIVNFSMRTINHELLHTRFSNRLVRAGRGNIGPVEIRKGHIFLYWIVYVSYFEMVVYLSYARTLYCTLLHLLCSDFRSENRVNMLNAEVLLVYRRPAMLLV